MLIGILLSSIGFIILYLVAQAQHIQLNVRPRTILMPGGGFPCQCAVTVTLSLLAVYTCYRQRVASANEHKHHEHGDLADFDCCCTYPQAQSSRGVNKKHIARCLIYSYLCMSRCLHTLLLNVFVLGPKQ